jgi:hypothetical protein
MGWDRTVWFLGTSQDALSTEWHDFSIKKCISLEMTMCLSFVVFVSNPTSSSYSDKLEHGGTI